MDTDKEHMNNSRVKTVVMVVFTAGLVVSSSLCAAEAISEGWLATAMAVYIVSLLFYSTSRFWVSYSKSQGNTSDPDGEP